jgi:protein-tyrosine phosphatase
MDFDQVLERVIVGSCPKSTTDIDRLKEELHVTAVLNLQTDEDLDYLSVDWPVLENHYRKLAIDVRRVPVRDFDRDDLRGKLPDGVAALRELLEEGHTVYVHCTAGMGRSPSVVVAYLHWIDDWGLGEALNHVSSFHPCSPDAEAIRLAGDDAPAPGERNDQD